MSHYRIEIVTIVLAIVFFLSLFVLYVLSVDSRRTNEGLFNLFKTDPCCNPKFTKACSDKARESQFACVERDERRRCKFRNLKIVFFVITLAVIVGLFYNIYKMFADKRPAACGGGVCKPSSCGSVFPKAPDPVTCDFLDDTKPFEPILGVLAAPKGVQFNKAVLASSKSTDSHRTTFSLI